ncbi:MAG: uracil-DNA glycosylase [Lactobacillus sp.]|jgi:DNA polymerase|nr:uracil-DNA glycosylase [Lactobacillus sp.]MCI2032720.1 uracil-DNA glycosylase [Lactobacillus sp.]
MPQTNPLSAAQLAQAKALVFPDTQGFVPGYGSLRPQLVLVGEAPGETEVTSGRPFTGRAGAKLDLMLAALGLSRETVFVTMTFHRRPTKRKPNGKLGNRPPTAAEWLREGWLLDAELAAFPEVPLLLMGNTALRRLYHGQVKDWHGQWLQAPVAQVVAGALQPGASRRFAVCAHPAALLYRQATQAQTLADLAQIRQLLEASNCKGKCRTI